MSVLNSDTFFENLIQGQAKTHSPQGLLQAWSAWPASKTLVLWAMSSREEFTGVEGRFKFQQLSGKTNLWSVYKLWNKAHTQKNYLQESFLTAVFSASTHVYNVFFSSTKTAPKASFLTSHCIVRKATRIENGKTGHKVSFSVRLFLRFPDIVSWNFEVSRCS